MKLINYGGEKLKESMQEDKKIKGGIYVSGMEGWVHCDNTYKGRIDLDRITEEKTF